MIICISGYTGAGKDAIGMRLSKALNIRHVNRSYKEFVKDHMDVIKFSEEADAKFSKNFDGEVIKAAHAGSCVVTTWLGPWVIKDADIRVWLHASIEERARRKAKDLGMSTSEAISYIKKRDMSTAGMAKRAYGSSMLEDRSAFDVEINTEKVMPEEAVSMLSLLAVSKSGSAPK